MGAVVADTHVALWYLLESRKLSANALEALEQALRSGDGIRVSSISLVETTYLVEKGRLLRRAHDMLEQVLSDPAEGFHEVHVDLEVARSLRHVPRELVPDMPDRIIAATALHLNLPLVTHDKKIHGAGIQAIW